MTKPPSLFLFNEDLRLRDNPALYKAAQTKKPLILLYIYDTTGRKLGSSHQWWLHHSLISLQKSLGKSKLVLRKGDPKQILLEVVKSSKADSVFWNYPRDPGSAKRYAAIQKQLVSSGVDVDVHSSNLLVNPTEIETRSGSYFKVFTPFWKHCLKVLAPPKPLPEPQWASAPSLTSEKLETWNLLTKDLSNFWTPGEMAGQAILKKFLQKGLQSYASAREMMDLSGTSRLSPYLHWGEVSVREIWHAIHKQKQSHGAQTFLNELGFREFSYYLLHHFPSLPTANFRSEFDHFPWQDERKALKAWQEGNTGYPIVDAGMRQLRETGWMHNRARMIVGSFLTKDLLIDWRKGEAWFWDLLVDGDLALNAFNWQWVAGSGVDAAPYFRIFNPTLQGEKYDPDGNYVRHWVPELAHLPSNEIHSPEEVRSYPNPIVDHSEMRTKALALYRKIAKKKS